MTRRRFTPAGHKPRISAVYEKNRSARLGEPVFCVLRILWINDVINVFGKEECVQGTPDGFLARSIPARRRHGLQCRPHSTKIRTQRRLDLFKRDRLRPMLIVVGQDQFMVQSVLDIKMNEWY